MRSGAPQVPLIPVLHYINPPITRKPHYFSSRIFLNRFRIPLGYSFSHLLVQNFLKKFALTIERYVWPIYETCSILFSQDSRLHATLTTTATTTATTTTTTTINNNNNNNDYSADRYGPINASELPPPEFFKRHYFSLRIFFAMASVYLWATYFHIFWCKMFEKRLLKRESVYQQVKCLWGGVTTP
jgi:hypothetical protein